MTNLPYDEEEYYRLLDGDRCATPGEALAEYAHNAGAENAGYAWVLTPWDTWERNPFYRGPAVPHPESDEALYGEEA